MSLNLWLPSREAVVRVHQPFESARRLSALRALRRRLDESGRRVARPLPAGGRELLRWEGRWVEMEARVPHRILPPVWDSYRQMYQAMGRLHACLRRQGDLKLPRPAVATYGPPRSLRRWMGETVRSCAHDPRGRALASWSARLIAELARQWVPAAELPRQIVHGDIRLENVGLDPGGEPVYLDFGFAAERPRLHDLGYSLAWMVLRPDDSGTGEDFCWEKVSELVDAYEAGAETRLSEVERSCLGAYTAAVPLYLAAISGFMPDPVAHLRDNERFLRIAEWILTHRPRL